MLDAIYPGVEKMRHAKYQRKALLIISDGGDNRSRYTEGEIKNQVKETDVLIYAIGIYDNYFPTEEEGIELRNQYVLGYSPKNFARDGKWHKVKVKLVVPKGLPPLQVHAKMGFYAPSE